MSTLALPSAAKFPTPAFWVTFTVGAADAVAVPESTRVPVDPPPPDGLLVWLGRGEGFEVGVATGAASIQNVAWSLSRG